MKLLGRGIRRRDGVPPRALADIERENRRLRRRIRKLRAELKLTEEELAVTRRSVADPDPTLVVPAEVDRVIEQVKAEKLSYLSRADLRTLARLVLSVEASGTEGVIVEAGSALGGSAIVMAAAKSADRTLKVYDVFGMIPPPSERDGDDVHARYDAIVKGQSQGLGGDTYYGYRSDLLEEVTDSFRRLGVETTQHSVELVQGLFEDTIDIDEPVAFAHLDGDWYDSTMVCLERIAPRLVTNGRIVLDDYYIWSGCRAAVDDYLKEHDDLRLELRARAHLVKR